MAKATKVGFDFVISPSRLWEGVRDREVDTSHGKKKVHELFNVGTTNYYTLVHLAVANVPIRAALKKDYAAFLTVLQTVLAEDTPSNATKSEDAAAIVAAINLGVETWSALELQLLADSQLKFYRGSFQLYDANSVPIKMGDHLRRPLHVLGDHSFGTKHHGLYIGTSEEVIRFNVASPGAKINAEILAAMKVVTGEKWAIHFTKLGNEQPKARIMLTTLAVFIDGDENLEKVEYPEESSIVEVMSRAMEKFGEENYDILGNNCEHFATFCKTGKAVSLQAGFTGKVIRLLGGWTGAEYDENEGQ